MATLFIHFFAFAETYAVLLVWVTVPLAFYASYLFMNNHFGMFEPAVDREEKNHGAN